MARGTSPATSSTRAPARTMRGWSISGTGACSTSPPDRCTGRRSGRCTSGIIVEAARWSRDRAAVSVPRKGCLVIYRSLGDTGLQVSALSYGASPLGSVFRPIDEAEGIRTVHTALDLGINFIDVSPYYGLTRAEAVLGKALAAVPRDRYLLATKVGRYGQD